MGDQSFYQVMEATSTSRQLKIPPMPGRRKIDSCGGIRRESLSFGKFNGDKIVGCALDREPVEGGDLGTAGRVTSRTARGDGQGHDGTYVGPLRVGKQVAELVQHHATPSCVAHPGGQRAWRGGLLVDENRNKLAAGAIRGSVEAAALGRWLG